MDRPICVLLIYFFDVFLFSMKRSFYVDENEPPLYGLQGSSAQPKRKETRVNQPSSATLSRLMAQPAVVTGPAAPLHQVRNSVLCEACSRARLAPEPPLSGTCNFCSRKRVCGDCSEFCSSCTYECCSVCSVKDYSGSQTLTRCLSCAMR